MTEKKEEANGDDKIVMLQPIFGNVISPLI